MMVNVYAAWIAIMVGVLTGITTGVFFQKEEFLGGYGSWTRRLMRLGHVSFFGLGFINLLFALTVLTLEIESGIEAASVFFVIGLITMPMVCYLSAFRKVFRHLFFIPVLSILTAVMLFLWRLQQL
jgi:hypothetical protein